MFCFRAYTSSHLRGGLFLLMIMLPITITRKASDDKLYIFADRSAYTCDVVNWFQSRAPWKKRQSILSCAEMTPPTQKSSKQKSGSFGGNGCKCADF